MEVAHNQALNLSSRVVILQEGLHPVHPDLRVCKDGIFHALDHALLTKILIGGVKDSQLLALKDCLVGRSVAKGIKRCTYLAVRHVGRRPSAAFTLLANLFLLEAKGLALAGQIRYIEVYILVEAQLS